MAKFERTIRTDIHALAAWTEHIILENSMSASLEDTSDFVSGSAVCCVRVFERFSYLGQNRVSLSVTFFDGGDGNVHISAIASGGSQAMMFKINTFGEENFLEEYRSALNRYQP